jgi:hypothetical protein
MVQLDFLKNAERKKRVKDSPETNRNFIERAEIFFMG